MSFMLLCCGLLLVCAGCGENPDSGVAQSEFEIDKDFERGPLTVYIRADKSTMTIAETFLNGVTRPKSSEASSCSDTSGSID